MRSILADISDARPADDLVERSSGTMLVKLGWQNWRQMCSNLKQRWSP